MKQGKRRVTARDACACFGGEGGPPAGSSEPCLAPMGAALPKPTFPRGVRPRLSLADGIAAAPAAKEGHEEAETGAGARAPAEARAGAVAATPRRANWHFGTSSEGAGERLLPAPHYSYRLSAFIRRCCNASETPQKAAALLISWEANERLCRGTCLYSHGAWHRQRSRSPSPRACRKQLAASPAPGVVARARSCAEEGTGHPCPSHPWGGCRSYRHRSPSASRGFWHMSRASMAPMEKASGDAGEHGPLSCGDAAIPEDTRASHMAPATTAKPWQTIRLTQPQPAQAACPWHAELRMAKKASQKKGERALPVPSPLPGTSDAVVAVPCSASETSAAK